MKKIIVSIIVISLLVSTTPTIMCVEETIDEKQLIDYDDLEIETISKYGTVTEYGGPELDFDFIYKVVENLSNIVKKYPMGRDFGSPGEHYARDLIIGWMKEIVLAMFIQKK